MEPPIKACELPDFVKGRLIKAQGHINATGRKLWHDTDRGLWSARQAKARLAETWLWLEEGAEFPPLDRYLAREVVQARLEAFAQAPMSDAVKAAWMEMAAAEEAILETGFPTASPHMDQEALKAGMARERRYLDSLSGLMHCVEDAIAERFVDLRLGEWVRMRAGPTGQVLGWNGLTVGIFAVGDGVEGEDGPNHATTDDAERNVRHYTLLYAEITRARPPEHPPITEPSYYWMLSAHDRLRKVSHLIRNADWLVLADVERMLSKTLDAVAKAWWAAVAPVHARAIGGIYPARNVESLDGRAPSPISGPLGRCLRGLRALTKKRMNALPAEPASWRSEMEELLPLVEAGLAAVEPVSAPRIDLTAGDWVSSNYGHGRNHGHGRIAARNGTKIVVDLGLHGLREVELFRESLQRVPPPDDMQQYEGLPRWHTRWRWFVLNPGACGGRGTCPCCGLPGVEAEGRPCRLCGWIHDGGDFNPNRLSGIHHDLTLDLARSRFDALGYAAAIRDSAAKETAWRDRRAGIRRKRLVDALDGLVDDAPGENGRLPAKVETLWIDYEACLQPALAPAEK